MAKKSPNPYLISVLTAVMAGIISIVGSYFTAEIQAKHAVSVKFLEYRAQAYSTFLERVDRNRSPLISKLLNIGSLGIRVRTDGEIQALEDSIANLLKNLDPQDAYWQLSSDFSYLRLHGSEAVQRNCSDILELISFNDTRVNWSQYPQDIQLFYQRMRYVSDHGTTFGWKPKVTDQERLTVVMAATLFQNLLREMRSEVRETQPNQALQPTSALTRRHG